MELRSFSSVGWFNNSKVSARELVLMELNGKTPEGMNAM
jgi:hypothetical protein